MRGKQSVRRAWRTIGVLLGFAAVVPAMARAQQPPRVERHPPREAHDPASLAFHREAAARHEAQRRAAIGMQLDTIGWMKARAGLPPTSGYIFSSPWVPYARVAPQPIGQRHVQTGPNRWESYPVYPWDLAHPKDEWSEPRRSDSPPPMPLPAAPHDRRLHAPGPADEVLPPPPGPRSEQRAGERPREVPPEQPENSSGPREF